MPGVIREEFIIRTKLHRPVVSKNHLHRENLLERFSRPSHLPLTLVSAPAGYGKSSFVSCWLDARSTPSSWVSLDEHDNDLRLFLSYFISAIQQLFPLACGETLAMLKVAHLPPGSVLTSRLINELEQIQKEFFLVLDDYHLIRDKNVHQFVANLLKYPPVCMCLVLICRRDPPLPLTTLRAREQMVEIRTRDLRFSLIETKELLQLILGTAVDNAIVAILEHKTEGWVTGLRLAALSLRYCEDLQLKLADLQVENRYILNYLLDEILSHQPPAMQEYMLKCSILDRFCASLCEAVCSPDKDPSAGGLPGSDFLEILDSEKLFVISLDDVGEWFRFHHLFQALLKRQLKKQLEVEDISRLNKLASSWFAENEFVDEAISHGLESGDKQVAVRLVKQHRHDIIKREQWFHLDRWLQKFPVDYIKTDPELLLTKAWVYQRQARYSELLQILDEIEHLVFFSDEEPGTCSLLLGEFLVLKSFQYYSTGQAKLSETTARMALDCLPLRYGSNRGFALMILSMALQMQGKTGQGYQIVHEAMQHLPAHKNMSLVALCYISWVTADSKRLKLAAAQLLKHGQENNLPETAYNGRFFSGILCYQQNDLDSVEHFLAPVATSPVIGELAIPSIVTYCQSSLALSSTYQALGREQEAVEILESVIGYMLESGNVDLLELCQAFQADLALRMGKVAEADLWIQNHTQRPLAPAYRFYTADLTPPRVLLARRTAKSLSEADMLLSQLYKYHAAMHNTRMLIEVLALQTQLHAAREDEKKAFNSLVEVLALAEPGGFMRPFLDQGPEMADLLARLLDQNPTLDYARQIYLAFGHNKNSLYRRRHDDITNLRPAQSAEFFVPPLTKREIEVLRILSRGMSNNEIASSLYISTETVKRHLSTIYLKLEAKNRAQAIMIGKSIGIL